MGRPLNGHQKIFSCSVEEGGGNKMYVFKNFTLLYFRISEDHIEKFKPLPGLPIATTLTEISVHGK